MHSLHEYPASFETRSATAPQDEEDLFVTLKAYLILRKPRSGCLEGRTAPIPFGFREIDEF
jgi:hypothetical protein